MTGDLDMSLHKISNVLDPTADQDAATKKYVDDNATGSWEVDGTETQLKTADEVDMQSKKIINLASPVAADDAATKYYAEYTPIIKKVFIDTYEGDGTDNKILDLRDDYSEIHIYIEESVGGGSHFVSAYAIGGTYGLTFMHNSDDENRHYAQASANTLWQGKVFELGHYNEIKLGSSGASSYGTNYNGWTYKIIAYKYGSGQTEDF